MRNRIKLQFPLPGQFLAPECEVLSVHEEHPVAHTRLPALLVDGVAPLTASAAARSVASVTAAYRRIVRSVFHPARAITIGAVKPASSAIVATWWRRSWKWKSLSPAPRGGFSRHPGDMHAAVRRTFWPGENLGLVMRLELSLDEFLGVLGKHNGPGTGLRARKEDNPLL